jgi:lambda repressor-like predicted transcriptional regulator
MLKGLVARPTNELAEALSIEPVGDIKVAYDDLTKDQKAALTTIEGDFKIYVNGRMPTNLPKDKLIKEPFFKTTDIIDVVKACLKKTGPELYDLLVQADISPVVLSMWLMRPCSKDIEALEALVQMESYVYQKDVYFSLLSVSGLNEMGLKFSFYKKVRE